MMTSYDYKSRGLWVRSRDCWGLREGSRDLKNYQRTNTRKSRDILIVTWFNQVTWFVRLYPFNGEMADAMSHTYESYQNYDSLIDFSMTS
jgi:hypothetical protein